jgi:hypothetical protein
MYIPQKNGCIIGMPLLSQISCETPFRDLTGGKEEISHSITEKKAPG